MDPNIFTSLGKIAFCISSAIASGLLDDTEIDIFFLNVVDTHLAHMHCVSCSHRHGAVPEMPLTQEVN